MKEKLLCLLIGCCHIRVTKVLCPLLLYLTMFRGANWLVEGNCHVCQIVRYQVEVAKFLCPVPLFWQLATIVSWGGHVGVGRKVLCLPMRTPPNACGHSFMRYLSLLAQLFV